MLAILIGGGPITIAYFLWGVKGIEQELSGLTPPAVVIWWSFALTILGVLFLFLNYRTLKKSDRAALIWEWIHETAIELTASVVSILRLMAGLFMGLIIIWAAVEWESFDVKRGAFFLSYALVSLGESSILICPKQLYEKRC